MFIVELFEWEMSCYNKPKLDRFDTLEAAEKEFQSAVGFAYIWLESNAVDDSIDSIALSYDADSNGEVNDAENYIQCVTFVDASGFSQCTLFSILLRKE